MTWRSIYACREALSELSNLTLEEIAGTILDLREEVETLKGEVEELTAQLEEAEAAA